MPLGQCPRCVGNRTASVILVRRFFLVLGLSYLCLSPSTLSRSGFRKVFQISLPPFIGKGASGVEVVLCPVSDGEAERVSHYSYFCTDSVGMAVAGETLTIWADSHRWDSGVVGIIAMVVLVGFLSFSGWGGAG